MKQARWTFNRARKVYEPVELEEHVVKEIVERLWMQARIKVWRVRERIPQKGRRWQQLSTPGIPDLIGWIPSTTVSVCGAKCLRTTRPLFIECKRSVKSVRRPAQEAFIDEAKRDGCVAFFASSWGDVVRELGKVGVVLQA